MAYTRARYSDKSKPGELIVLKYCRALVVARRTARGCRWLFAVSQKEGVILVRDHSVRRLASRELLIPKKQLLELVLTAGLDGTTAYWYQRFDTGRVD